jgi:ferric-dicitrate binding protein FerR (iron transport regulator)
MSRDDSNVPAELREALEQARADGDGTPDLEEMWGLLDGAAPPDEALPDADETWVGVRDHIDEGGTDGERRAEDRRPRHPASSRSVQHRLRRWGSAVVAALLLVGAVWWWAQPVDVTAVPGTTVTRTLPDGSTVELHGDTRLTYPRTLETVSVLEAERRVVRLEGEAYFEVESGTRPFIVQTPSMRVEVMGTAFTVRSRPGEADDAHVALAEGRLRVTTRADTSTNIALRPGQAVTVGTNGALTAVRDTSIERITAWRRGGFAATARPLPALAQALERRFGQPIRLSSSINAETRSDPLTLYYSQGAELETILHDVSMARGLTYRSTAQGYILAQADDRQSP